MSTTDLELSAMERTFTAPATVTSGVGLMIGNLYVVPKADAASGDTFAGYINGRHSQPKTSAQAWTIGDPIYWSGTTLTNVQTGALKCVGQAAAAAANPSSTGAIEINVGIEADSDVGTLTANLANAVDPAKGAALIGYSGSTVGAFLATVPSATAATAAQEVIVSSAASTATKPLASVTATAASAGTGARLSLAEPTGGGASKVTLEAPALGGDATLTLPTASRDFANIPSMAANGTAGNLVYTAAGDKALGDASVVAANVVTQAANAAGAGTIPSYAGASKVLQDSTVPIANVPTMGAVGGVGTLVQTAAADRAQSDSGIAVANVVTNATGAAAGADRVVATGGADKTVKGTTILTADLPTQAANAGAAQQILVSAAADKSQKALTGVTATAADAGAGGSLFLGEATAGAQTVEVYCPAVLTGNRRVALPDRDVDLNEAVTMAGVAGGALNLPVFAGASRVLQDSGIDATTLIDTAIADTTLDRKVVTIALGAATGTTAADPTWVGATLMSCSALTNNDQIPVGFSVAGDGAVTVTVAANETAEATFVVVALI